MNERIRGQRHNGDMAKTEPTRRVRMLPLDAASRGAAVPRGSTPPAPTEKPIMIRTLSSSTSILSLGIGAIVLTAGLGCGSIESGDVSIPPPESASAAVAPSSAALRIEQALRLLDAGRDAAGARAMLDEALRDPALTPDERDEATLGLSRALEAQGDKEGAIRAVEDLLASHTNDRRWPSERAAEARLQKLVTGKDPQQTSTIERNEPTAPFARVLAPHFPPGADGSYELTVLQFGGTKGLGDQLGTFNIDGGIRELRREQCPLCDDRISVRSTVSRAHSWTDIPQNRAQMESALTVFYFDLDGWRIPARYDAYLPLPSATIVEHLERGEGLIASRERPGSPPVILIAAPRRAQHAAVEEALAAMTSLPAEPVTVAVAATLMKEEIQTVVRGARGAQKACYEGLLARSPRAEGRISLKFSIDASGRTADVASVPESPALDDATFVQCLNGAVSSLQFPATGKTTTVVYPLAVSP